MQQAVGKKALAVEVKLMDKAISGKQTGHGVNFILWSGVHIGLTLLLTQVQPGWISCLHSPNLGPVHERVNPIFRAFNDNRQPPHPSAQPDFDLYNRPTKAKVTLGFATVLYGPTCSAIRQGQVRGRKSEVGVSVFRFFRRLSALAFIRVNLRPSVVNSCLRAKGIAADFPIKQSDCSIRQSTRKRLRFGRDARR